MLRAAEIGAKAVLKATNVDGVYSADPKKDPTATRFDRLTHSQALEGGYKVMDATAFALARETAMPIIVFSIAESGSIGAILSGKGHGDHRRRLSSGRLTGQAWRGGRRTCEGDGHVVRII